MDTLYIGGKFIGHDAAIFVVFPNEKDVFAISNERLTRYKHDDLYPIAALHTLLQHRNIDPSGIRRVMFANAFVCQQFEIYEAKRYEMIQAKRQVLRAPYQADFQRAAQSFENLSSEEKVQFLQGTDQGKWLLQQITEGQHQSRVEPLADSMRRHIQAIFPNADIVLHHYDHQLCHAMSARMWSPFEKCLIVTCDGYGDGSFSKVYLSDEKGLTLFGESAYEHLQLSGKDGSYDGMGSPAGIYHYFTFLLGFQPDGDEGKVEALSAFGTPESFLLSELLGLFVLDKHRKCLVLQKAKAERVLNYERMRRLVETMKKEDLAATVQTFLEMVMVEYLKFVIGETGVRHICLSGGAAANVIMNLRIFELLTPHLYVVPAMADDGAAQGAAMLQLLDQGIQEKTLGWLKHRVMPYWGTSYAREDVRKRLETFSDQIEVRDQQTHWPEEAAKLVAEGHIGAIFQGRMEWGPRALGNRSIIADARNPHVRELVNKEIKKRPLFQPFCPSMLAEEQDRLFGQAYLNKHMTCAFRMKPEFRACLPSAVHIDGTARVQFVEEQDNPMYFRLLKKMKALTGYGVIVNTSFNRHGRTIVETPEDAIRDFLDTDLSFLMIEGWMVTRRTTA
ncbi:MAG: hypothetical protein KC643_25015 [Nitrospira sp.]|nr:hypothetical protein [Nitrospira sp.]MCA9499791.1 hypothetical protein [Nitrospira sp.]